jgi:hypothetical protein
MPAVSPPGNMPASRPFNFLNKMGQAMTNVSAAVMTVERPDSRLPHVLDRLRSLDPVIVENRGNPWKTARAAWGAARPGATHHLVVQDDIRIARGLGDAVRELAAGFPDRAFAFYAQWDTNSSYRVRMAAFGGDSIVQASAREWVPAQALLLPRRVCDAVCTMPDDLSRHDDEVLATVLYGAEFGCDVGISVPNLVEHDDNPDLAYNSQDGLRRTACFVGEDIAWQAPDSPSWDGQGWGEISVALGPAGTRLDWGMRRADRPRRYRQIHVPWRMAVPPCGLTAEEVAEISENVLRGGGVVRAAPAGEDDDPLRQAALFEYAVACVLHGVAWRNWWRGGQPAAGLNRSKAADAAMISLWRCCADLPMPPDLLTQVGWEALLAGAELGSAAGQEESHARLAEWFHATRWGLSRPLWSEAARSD